VRKIAICNQKGGVGKTATAVNIAAGLSLAERSTILVDIDPQANATSGLGIDYKTLESSVYDCLFEPVRVREIIVKTKWPRLAVLPSTSDLAGAEIELVDKEGREERLKRILEVIDGDFAYGIIDCPPSLGLLTVNGLVACDSVIIPIQCEYYALEGLEKLLKTLKKIKNSLNDNLVIDPFDHVRSPAQPGQGCGRGYPEPFSRGGLQDRDPQVGADRRIALLRQIGNPL
jgi:chromosome partitioning protein